MEKAMRKGGTGMDSTCGRNSQTDGIVVEKVINGGQLV